MFKVKNSPVLVEDDCFGMRVITAEASHNFAAGRRAAGILYYDAEHGVTLAAGTLHTNS
jgi:hypothetical protein